MLLVYMRAIDDILSWPEYPQRHYKNRELHGVVEEVVVNARPETNPKYHAQLREMGEQILRQHATLLEK